MSEFLKNDIQTVLPNQPVILTTSISCPNGYVYHRPESGILTLRGVVKNCSNFARYQVTFNGNIAVPEDGTPGPIAIALALDGEPILTSRAIVTPAAVNEYFNVTSTAIITVPSGCCFNLSVENVSEPTDGISPEILVQNANLTVSRIS